MKETSINPLIWDEVLEKTRLGVGPRLWNSIWDHLGGSIENGAGLAVRYPVREELRDLIEKGLDYERV